MPEEKGGASLGTYVMPCRSFGLLDPTSGADGEPVRVPPRGQDIRKVRNRMAECEPVVEIVLEGGTLTHEHLMAAGAHYSVNGLMGDAEERRILVDSIFEPFDNTPEVESAYERLAATAGWVASTVFDAPRTSAEVIFENYLKVTNEEPTRANAVEIAWAEYELRRRVHFACELFVSDVTHTLMDLTAGSPEDIVNTWIQFGALPEVVRDVTSVL